MSAAVYRGCVVSGGNAAMLWTVEGGVYAVCGLDCSKSRTLVNVKPERTKSS